MLLAAYRQGIFPMADVARNRVDWYEADPRGVLPLDSFHLSRNVARLVRQRRFTIRVDHDVPMVMAACSGEGVRREGNWMNASLLSAYHQLHAAGHVHSVEAWLEGRLVGGLYGVRLGAAFFGESMFCRPDLGGSNASKVCLAHLVDRLRSGGFVLLDTQMVTAHMAQFGAIEIPLAQYRRQLAKALAATGDWTQMRTAAETTGDGGHSAPEPA